MTHVALTSVTSHVMLRDSEANVSDTVGSGGAASSASCVGLAAGGGVVAPPAGSSSPPPTSEIAKTIAPSTSRASTTMNAIHPALSRSDRRPGPPLPPRASPRPDAGGGVDPPAGPADVRAAAPAGATDAGGWYAGWGCCGTEPYPPCGVGSYAAVAAGYADVAP